MKLKTSILLLLINSSFLYSQVQAKVIGIKDGDTVLVLDKSNIQITLRLAEVDCPESGQPYGKNAKQFTSSQVFGKEIKFFKTGSYRYGRTIAKIYYDNGKYLSSEIIKNGLGWWYFKYSNNESLRLLEKKAKDLKIGLWADNNAVSPWDWRSMKNVYQ